MKKLLVIVSLILALCSFLSVTVFATGESTNPCQGCEICNPKEDVSIDEMPEMEFQIDGEGFLESLGYMGKGMVGIFVVTLVIVGVVAILNWHGRSLERRNNKKDE